MKRIKILPLTYGTLTSEVMPKQPQILGLTAQIDPNNTNVKPRLIYLQDTAYPQTHLKHYLLLRGQSDLEFPNAKNFRFVGVTQDQNRRTQGIATLWEVDLVEQDAPAEAPEPVKPKVVPVASPESLMAIKAHEDKIKKEKERLAENTYNDPVKQAQAEKRGPGRPKK